MTAELAQTSSSAINPYDIGIVVILLLSAFVGVLRGLTKEVLSIAGWLSAIIVTIYAYIPLRGLFRHWIGNAFLADLATILFVFITSLVIFTMIIGSVSDKVKRSRLGGLDRSLGLVFGTARAGVVVEGLFLLSLLFWKVPHERPLDLQYARALPHLEQGAQALFTLAPQGLIPENFRARVSKQTHRSAQELLTALSRPKPQEITPTKPDQEEVPYTNTKRQEMDRLFKTLEKK